MLGELLNITSTTNYVPALREIRLLTSSSNTSQKIFEVEFWAGKTRLLPKKRFLQVCQSERVFRLD